MKGHYIALLAALAYTQAEAFDLPAQAVKAYDCLSCSKLARETLNDKWELDDFAGDVQLSNAQKSYGFKQKISAAELHAGIAITTLAPGAVLRIVPLQDHSLPAMELVSPDKKALPLTEASALYDDQGKLGDTIRVKNQALLQIKPELGSGTFLLKSKEDSYKASDTYLVSLLDKMSLTYIQVETDSLRYKFGDTLKASITLNNDNEDYEATDLSAYLVNPRGEMLPLDLDEVSHNHFQAAIPLTSDTNDEGENWYVEADAITKLGSSVIRRSGHTAFSYYIPSASVLSITKLKSKPLTFSAKVQVATASRYVLQSILFKNAATNKPFAIETSQVAAWLEPGVQEIQFTFDNLGKLTDDQLLLGYLQLTDYGQLKTVYQYNPPIRLTQLGQ